MEEKSYRKLQWKIVATTLSFSLIPLFALGLSIYYQFSVSYTAKIIEMLGNRVENRRNAIDLFFDERVSQLYTLAYTHSFDHLQKPVDINDLVRVMELAFRQKPEVLP